MKVLLLLASFTADRDEANQACAELEELWPITRNRNAIGQCPVLDEHLADMREHIDGLKKTLEEICKEERRSKAIEAAANEDVREHDNIEDTRVGMEKLDIGETPTAVDVGAVNVVVTAVAEKV